LTETDGRGGDLKEPRDSSLEGRTMPEINRPNILILMMDTQGARNMSCYGYRLMTTPNIDAIAGEGTLFERHFVTAPWTLPVHASLFTGRYESGHGAGAQHEGLEPGLPSLPEVLTRNGYRTAAFCNNSWAIADDRWNPGAGFEEHVRYSSPEVEVEDDFVHDTSLGDDSGSLKLVGVAKNWLERNVLDGDGRPFFLFLHNGAPHDPYLPPEPFRSRFLPEGVSFDDAVGRKGNQVASAIGKRALTLEEWHWQRALYDGETACLDDRIGRLDRILKGFALAENTLFIVLGDHGDTQGEHIQHAYHSQNAVYDGLARTPLVARLPGVLPAGRRVKELVQVVDIFPAVLDLLRLDESEARESIQGHSLLGSLKGPIRRFALIEAQTPIHVLRRAWELDPDCDPRFAFASLKAARTKRYKYIWHSLGRDMLFDVVNDPDERWNIIDRRPETARKLKDELEDFLMSIEQRYYQDFFRPGRKRDAHVVRKLCAWGLYRPGVVPPWDPENPQEPTGKRPVDGE
jgi:arylsulfatase A-like enzyme